MPCIAPSRNNLKVQGPCGYETYAANLCKPHWQMANGLVPGVGADSFTVLLLHCDGVNGSTVFTDSSPSAKIVSANAAAKVDTAQSKFGGGSLLSLGPTDNLTVADSEDWNLGAGDFTIDMWVRLSAISLPAYCGLISQYGAPGNQGWVFYFQNNLIYFGFTPDGTAATTLTAPWVYAINQWYHVAVTRSGTSFRIFVDGVQVGSTLNSGLTIFNSTFPLCVGGFGSPSSSPPNGWLDEVRISKGIARWTANFSPPAAPY